MNRLEKKISDFLDSLGPTPDDVALSLKEMGIRGIRGRACYCPIAEAVVKTIVKLGVVNVRKKLFDKHCYEVAVLYNGRIRAVVNTPDAISRFIRRFDDGKYPELERS